MSRKASSSSTLEYATVELGNFEDLQTLINLLNRAFPEMEYRLEPVSGQKGVYLFIEDPLDEEEYECGVVQKRGKKVYALSPAVHTMILGAYQRYLDESAE